MRIVTLPRSEILAAVHDYFWARDEDPTVISRDFFDYHLRQGRSPEQIYRIACGMKES